MRFITLFSLYIGAASAFSPANLVARGKTPTTTGTSYTTKTIQDTVTATTTSTITYTNTKVVTYTSVVTASSILSKVATSTSVVTATATQTKIATSTSVVYLTSTRTTVVKTATTFDATSIESTTLDSYITLPASTLYVTQPATTVFVTQPAATSLVTQPASTVTVTQDVTLPASLTTQTITVVSTLVEDYHYTSTLDVTVIDYVLTTSATTTTTSTPVTTSSLPTTITQYEDTTCSISGTSNDLGTTKISSFNACLQYGAGILGDYSGYILWECQACTCDVVSGNGPVTTTFNPDYYCGVVQGNATVPTSSVIPVTSTIPTPSTLPATPTIATSTSTPTPAPTPYQCPGAGPIPYFANTSIVPWCDFECDGGDSDGYIISVDLDSASCLEQAGEFAVTNSFFPSYVSWQNSTDICILWTTVYQTPAQYGVTTSSVDYANADFDCAAVTEVVYDDCTNGSTDFSGFETFCGHQCTFSAADYNTDFFNVSTTASTFPDCVSFGITVSNTGNTDDVVAINWNRVTTECLAYISDGTDAAIATYSPNWDCASFDGEPAS